MYIPDESSTVTATDEAIFAKAFHEKLTANAFQME
jgi:hypothetical protein